MKKRACYAHLGVGWRAPYLTKSSAKDIGLPQWQVLHGLSKRTSRQPQRLCPELRGNNVYNAIFSNYLGAQVIALPTGEV